MRKLLRGTSHHVACLATSTVEFTRAYFRKWPQVPSNRVVAFNELVDTAIHPGGHALRRSICCQSSPDLAGLRYAFWDARNSGKEPRLIGMAEPFSLENGHTVSSDP